MHRFVHISRKNLDSTCLSKQTFKISFLQVNALHIKYLKGTIILLSYYDKHWIHLTIRSSMLNITLIVILIIFFPSSFFLSIDIEWHAPAISFEAVKSNLSFLPSMVNTTFDIFRHSISTTKYTIF